jgi:glycosyltransferase involved in cell wall biosynthesis
MAAGLPVIISNMSSGPELVKHRIDGWLCDPSQPHTLVERMNEAACSESLRKTISKAALNKINTRFNFNAFIEKNINFYEDLLSK